MIRDFKQYQKTVSRLFELQTLCAEENEPFSTESVATFLLRYTRETYDVDGLPQLSIETHGYVLAEWENPDGRWRGCVYLPDGSVQHTGHKFGEEK